MVNKGQHKSLARFKNHPVYNSVQFFFTKFRKSKIDTYTMRSFLIKKQSETL
jgi:hypothetical protein